MIKYHLYLSKMYWLLATIIDFPQNTVTMPQLASDCFNRYLYHDAMYNITLKRSR